MFFYFNYFENLSINKKITQSKSGVSKLSMVLKALNNNTPHDDVVKNIFLIFSFRCFGEPTLKKKFFLNKPS